MSKSKVEIDALYHFVTRNGFWNIPSSGWKSRTHCTSWYLPIAPQLQIKWENLLLLTMNQILKSQCKSSLELQSQLGKASDRRLPKICTNVSCNLSPEGKMKLNLIPLRRVFSLCGYHSVWFEHEDIPKALQFFLKIFVILHWNFSFSHDNPDKVSLFAFQEYYRNRGLRVCPNMQAFKGSRDTHSSFKQWSIVHSMLELCQDIFSFVVHISAAHYPPVQIILTGARTSDRLELVM